MKVQLLLAPYDSGHREWRMGRGPSHLVRHGIASGLRALGHEVDAEYVEPPRGDETIDKPLEIKTSFGLYRELAIRVRAALDAGTLPIVLGGNCGVTLSALAASAGRASNGEAPGVVWLDAHGDLNTPDSSASGFLDGMMLATLTGRAWRALTAKIPGFRAVPDDRVVLVGVRDLDPAERALLADGTIAAVRGETIRRDGVAASLGPALDVLRTRTERVHLHLDCDVIDSAVARANRFATEGGLDVEQLVDVVRMVAARFNVVSASVTAYDPEEDAAGAMPPAIAAALEALVLGARG